jgi:hypothetical protein
VIGASVYRKRKEGGEKRASEEAYLQRAIGYMTDLHKMGVAYFTKDRQVPEGFRTRFKPANEADERRSIICVWVESKKPTSASFDTEVTEPNYELASPCSTPARMRSPKRISGCPGARSPSTRSSTTSGYSGKMSSTRTARSSGASR